MVTIHSEKCKGCLNCVYVCPFAALTVKDGKPDLNQDNLCIQCLHCAAVCPQNAINLGNLDVIVSVDIPVFPENFTDLLEGYLMTRRSYRHFKQETVPTDILNHALWVSAWAPSAKNQRPTRWIVINDENKISNIMEHILNYVKETGIFSEILKIYEHGQNVVIGNAKTLLFAYARNDAANPAVDSALALYNIELILQAQGVGTCWAGYLTKLCNQIPALKDLLGLPEGYQFYGALMIGYPDDHEQYIHIPNRYKLPEVEWL